MVKERIEKIEAEDGGTFEARVIVPAAGHGACVILISDIYGLDKSTMAAAERLAELGYVVAVPDLFWRSESRADPGPDRGGPLGDNRAMERAKRWDRSLGLSDLGQVFRRVHELPELEGAVGVVGLGFGAAPSVRLAAESDPACVIAYLGAALANEAALLERIDCPTMLHVWRADPSLSADDLDLLQAAATANNQVVMHVHAGAGPGFDPVVAEQDLAMGAWTESAAFLYMHLGGPGRGA